MTRNTRGKNRVRKIVDRVEMCLTGVPEGKEREKVGRGNT